METRGSPLLAKAVEFYKVSRKNMAGESFVGPREFQQHDDGRIRRPWSLSSLHNQKGLMIALKMHLRTV